MKKFLRISLFLSFSVFLCGWGYNGHKIINNRSIFSFPAEMDQFRIWQQLLEQHASDADNRKSTDPDEAPKHYIDIDNYPEFVSNGFITQNFDSAVALHGYSFIIDQGILPWAIITTYDSLTQSFIRRDWNKAVLFASDLGHYVADAHMPLHITRNYNGQYSGQTGIHSRYESTMINRYYTQINYNSDTAVFISDVSGFVFSMVYSNYAYVDSLLAAELLAKTAAGNTTSDLYYQKLWEYTSGFTTKLFKNASASLAGLIYSSWVTAGKPSLITAAVEEAGNNLAFTLEQNYPNPFNPSTTISYSLNSPGNVNVTIYNIQGEIVAVPVKAFQSSGEYSIRFDGSFLPSGTYIYTLQAGGKTHFGKMMLLK